MLWPQHPGTAPKCYQRCRHRRRQQDRQQDRSHRGSTRCPSEGSEPQSQGSARNSDTAGPSFLLRHHRARVCHQHPSAVVLHLSLRWCHIKTCKYWCKRLHAAAVSCRIHAKCLERKRKREREREGEQTYEPCLWILSKKIQYTRPFQKPDNTAQPRQK